MKKNLIKKITLIIGMLLLIGGGFSLYVYNVVSTGFDIDKTTYIYIDDRKDYDTLLADIQHKARIKRLSAFEQVASFLKYKSAIKTGRYAIKPNMDVLEVVRLLRSGNQTPVSVKFNNIRTKDDLAIRISEQLMFKKDDLLRILDNPADCDRLGFTTETIIAMFIPNTYEFYWDVNVNTFVSKMKKEYDNFWNESRIAKAKKIGLSSLEVSVLASIVEEECTYQDEYPIVAGLYLNRLRRGQLLQADPTVKFAVGDFTLRRILNKHLEVDSPYNTYLYSGLPPAPIRIPSIKGIDAVLNFTESEYLYMCAKEDFSGRHNFANTFSQHQQNAVRYRNALNNRGIF